MNTKRNFLKITAWSAPIISSSLLPAHAQNSPVTPPPVEPPPCQYEASTRWEITALTTTDDWFGTELPNATWIPSGDRESFITIDISGSSVVMTINGSFFRTSAPVPFAAWGSTTCMGTFDEANGVINITSIGATGPHPDSGTGPRPGYYVPESGFSLDYPCGATMLTMTFPARLQDNSASGFTNTYTLVKT